MYVVLLRREVPLQTLDQIDALGPFENRDDAVRLTKDLQLAGREALLRTVLPEDHPSFPDIPWHWRGAL